MYSEFKTTSTRIHEQIHQTINLDFEDENSEELWEDISLEIGIKKLNECSVENFSKKENYQPGLFLFSVVDFIFSAKTVEEIFKQIIADWHIDYNKALSEEKIWKSRWINLRNTCIFLRVMCQKSPMAGLIEFIIKIAK